MVSDTLGGTSGLLRRDFLRNTGSVLAGMAAGGWVEAALASTPKPRRGGVLRFATRGDTTGLDPHRNSLYPVSTPLAAITQGLLDLDLHSEPVPGIATEWDVSPDLLTYTFKLRQGVLFHNGREVDAAAVKWNYERIKNPKTSSAFARSALENLKEVLAPDKYTVRCHLEQPSAAFLADVVFYPCLLPPIVKQRPIPTPWAVARSSSYAGNAIMSRNSRALRIILRRMPRAIVCPIWSVSSAIRSRKTVYV